jgi:toxin ParE1/3/4
VGAIRWTDEAIRWLVEIYDYIARDSPAAAQRVVDGIADKAAHYRIAYIVGPDRAVDIVGVYHTALDIERHLKIR